MRPLWYPMPGMPPRGGEPMNVWVLALWALALIVIGVVAGAWLD